jgi:hypothetical protein
MGSFGEHVLLAGESCAAIHGDEVGMIPFPSRCCIIMGQWIPPEFEERLTIVKITR